MSREQSGAWVGAGVGAGVEEGRNVGEAVGVDGVVGADGAGVDGLPPGTHW